MSDAAVELARQLVRVPSITPHDHGCQAILEDRLAAMGFTVHTLEFNGVRNFYARRGDRGPNLCFAGHTDVVPPGEESLWQAPPFAAQVVDGQVIGRGICDMKGGIACMVAAQEAFLRDHPDFAGSLSFLITGDEEGDAVDGTVRVLEWLKDRGERLDLCLVGESTNDERIGDGAKNGRRGSLNGIITIPGVQGHVAYPQRAENAIHRALAPLQRLAAVHFDQGSRDFPPSSLQFTHITSGRAETNNVIPGALTAYFNIRFGTAHTPDSLLDLVHAALAGSGAKVTSKVSGLPFLTDSGPVTQALARAVQEVCGQPLAFNTAGGTSDARFIARHCPQTVEFGLLNKTIHKVNEACPVADLHLLTAVYVRFLEQFL